ncbi:double zinc ribbon domain-containing protein [Streptococcus suis]|uniref:double zinc ribbon domain-containing protein n=1 Tax=Streptococcus suis TaxID=1307 RepID=UPI0003FA1BA5|nr:zinc ribbon domain-containing protein [Streptococcus suis]SCG83817.1 hypothetical protein DW1_2253 [Proteiniborus sp. DW1]
MLAAKRIPNKPRYDYVKRTARKILLSNNINSLPTDIDLIFKANNIILFSESEAEQIAMSDLPHEFKNNKDIQAITQKRIIQGKSIYISIVKDRNRVPGNVRFSKAHELGHIFLKHFEEFDLPSSLNISNSHEYWVLEREAEMFAAELLAPTAILRACNCFDKESIKSLCNLSEEASEYVICDIRRDYHLMEREKAALECQFDDFIRNKKYLLLTSPAFCGNCGAPLKPADRYCIMCGFKTTNNVNIDKVFLYPTTIPLKSTGRVYYCLRCGEIDLPLSSKICNVCSAPLYNLCTNCNSKLSGNDRFCGSCGGVSSFFQSRLLESWAEVQNSLNSVHKNQILNYRKINFWDYIIEKLLDKNKLDVHRALFGSCGYDDCGKLIIAFESESNNLIDKDVILDEINAICLPYFDTTYDDIDIILT